MLHKMVALIVCVLLAGVLLVEFLPLERLHGWPLYAAVALVIAGAVLEVVLTLVHLAGRLLKATERE